jgi:uncharacterized protein YneF (UPF0154 family)
MVYVIGVIGFVVGFGVGQMVLMFLLRHKTNEDLKTDPRLKVYGLLNWLVAGLGVIVMVGLYNQYYG